MVVPGFKQAKRYNNTNHIVLLVTQETVSADKFYLNAADCYDGLQLIGSPGIKKIKLTVKIHVLITLSTNDNKYNSPQRKIIPTLEVGHLYLI